MALPEGWSVAALQQKDIPYARNERVMPDRRTLFGVIDAERTNAVLVESMRRMAMLENMGPAGLRTEIRPLTILQGSGLVFPKDPGSEELLLSDDLPVTVSLAHRGAKQLYVVERPREDDLSAEELAGIVGAVGMAALQTYATIQAILNNKATSE